jgi:2,4-dienoyl-CoA reductase-like NADH-dependent reductase (Old Yellow Enzyme family)/NADPH-dependent 2,4-dienoyl-CoA reductase/sulfur reductase-like enzyme
MAAKKNFPKLFEPARIGRLELKNRIIMPPMEPNFGSSTGEVTEQMIRYYEERAKGGVGLIVIHIVCFDYPVGKAVTNQISADNDKFIPGLSRLAETIHNWGAKCVVQLHHAGRQTRPEWIEGMQPVAPSDVPCPWLSEPPYNAQPRALTYEEVQGLVTKFVNATVRVAEAGFDGVQMHGAHGYLLGQFMSPLSNKRNDRYGGDFYRHMRFIREIIAGIRQELGLYFPILFRWSADEFFPGGITLEGPEGSGTGIDIAKAVEAAGVDCLCVSCGNYGSAATLLEPMSYEEGWRAYMAEKIKKQVKIPVTTVGVLRSPEIAERILLDGKADFVEIGRQLITDPEWPKKALEGRVEDILKCISCNHCIGARVFAMTFMTCTQNPEVGREYKDGWVPMKPAEKKKKVMVVGGGPAGMEAARVAALRGHTVVLCEKGDKLGGQLRLASLAPFKDKINWVTDWLITQVNKVGVKVETGATVDEQKIKAEKPDVVIIATGAEPLIPDIPGITGPNVITYQDLLSGAKSVPGKNVIVAGGGEVGLECATYLAKQGKQVTIVEALDDILLDVEPITKADMVFVRLPQLGVKWVTKTPIIEVTNKGVITADKVGNRTLMEADNVIVALGTKPVKELEAIARGAGVSEVYVVGDAKSSRKIVDAKYEGALVARQI